MVELTATQETETLQFSQLINAAAKSLQKNKIIIQHVSMMTTNMCPNKTDQTAEVVA
jgi:hypothetical protein